MSLNDEIVEVKLFGVPLEAVEVAETRHSRADLPANCMDPISKF